MAGKIPATMHPYRIQDGHEAPSIVAGKIPATMYIIELAGRAGEGEISS